MQMRRKLVNFITASKAPLLSYTPGALDEDIESMACCNGVSGITHVELQEAASQSECHCFCVVMYTFKTSSKGGIATSHFLQTNKLTYHPRE